MNVRFEPSRVIHYDYENRVSRYPALLCTSNGDGVRRSPVLIYSTMPIQGFVRPMSLTLVKSILNP